MASFLTLLSNTENTTNITNALTGSNALRMSSEYSEYQDSLQRLVDSESGNSGINSDILDYVNASQGISSPEDARRDLNSFIDGTLEVANRDKSVEFLFSIESNENSFISRGNADSIVEYKNKIIDNKFEIIKSKINAFSSIKDNHIFLQETILNKFDKFSQIINHIVTGIQEKTDRVVLNSFEKKLKDEYYQNEGFYFNKVSNFFINNFNNTDVDILEQDLQLINSDRSTKENLSNPFENDMFSDSLIKIIKDYPFRFSRPIKSTSNDLIIQSIINSARSIYTISPNGFLDENYTSDNSLKINFEEESFINLTTERDGFYIFDYLNENTGDFSIGKALKSNKLEKIKIDANQQKYNKNLSRAENNTLRRVSRDVSSRNIEFIDEEFSYGLETIDNSSVILFSKESNKFYQDSIYNIDFLMTNIDFSSSSTIVPGIALYQVDLLTDLQNKVITDVSEGTQNAFIINTIVNDTLSGNNFRFNDLNYNANNAFETFMRNINNINSLKKFIYYRDQRIHIPILSFSTFLKQDITFNVDYYEQIDFDELIFKLKVDSFVKKTKIKNLENNDINVNAFKEVIKNIKNINSENKSRIVSYSKNNEKKKSSLNKKNVFYDLLFTEDGGIDHSHIDIFTNHKINNSSFRGLDELKKRNLEFNEKRDNVKNNFKNILSYYYPKCNFYSSSKFFKNVIKEIIRDVEVFSNSIENYQNEVLNGRHATIQALYLNSFKNNTIENISKSIVAKRFLKKSILLDDNSSANLNRSSMSDYSYEEININDFSNESESSINDYLKNIINSSENLKVIRASVFGNKNISDLSSQSNYKNFSNLNTLSDQQNKLYLYNYSSGLSKSFNQPGEFSGFREKTTQIFLETSGGFTAESDGFSIDSLNQINNYARTFLDENFDNQRLNLTGKMHFNVFPFHIMEYDFIIEGNKKASESLKFKFDIKEKNNIKSFINNNGETLYKPEYENFDITNSKNIKIKLTPKFNDARRLRDSPYLSNPEIVVEDFFDTICEKEGTLFNSINNTIKEFLRLTNRNYSNLYFSNEEDVDNFIAENEDLIDEIQTILEIYSEIYVPIFNRIQRKSSIKFFINDTAARTSNSLMTNNVIQKWVFKSFDQAPIDLIFNEEESASQGSRIGEFIRIWTNLFPSDDVNNPELRLEDFKNQFFDFNDGYYKFKTETYYEERIVNNNRDEYLIPINGLVSFRGVGGDLFDEDVVSDLKNIDFEIDESYENQENTAYNNSILTPLTEYVKSVNNTLKKSDLLQAFNFDIINGAIDFQDNLNSKSRNELSSSISFDKLKRLISNEDAEEIENNFYDIFYVNCLSRKIFQNVYTNSKLQRVIVNGLDGDIEYFKNGDYVNNFKNIEKNKNKFLQVQEDEINSNFYVFGLRKDQLENISYNSLIKFTVNIVDKFNLNHIYVPKTYLFSPLFMDPGRFISEDLEAGLSDDSIFGFYKLNQNIQNRTGIVNANIIASEIFSNPENFLINLIKNKLNIDNQGDASLLYFHMVFCHINSRKNKSIVNSIHNLNNFDSNNKEIDNNILNKMQELSNKEFFNIFDIKKDKAFEGLSLGAESVFNSLEKNDISNEVLKYLSKVGEFNSLYESDYYEIYNIGVDPKEFFYFDITNLSNQENFNNDINDSYTPNNTESCIFIKNLNIPYGAGLKFFKLKNLSLENLNIEVKVEVL